MPPNLHLRSLGTTLAHLILWTPGVIFVTDHVFTLNWVRGRSMRPTLSPHSHLGQRDCVFVRKLWSEDKSRVGRGEVVLLRSPVDAEQVVVKRVVGVEGDVVRVRRRPGGRALAQRAREALVDGGWDGYVGYMGRGEGVVVIPKGFVWVEGDEGFHSRDSNEYGPIPRGLLTARVTHIVWPPSRIGRVPPNPAAIRNAVLVKAEEQLPLI